MTRIRIVLAALPALLRDIIADRLAHESDMEVVATIASTYALDGAVREFHPDIVLVAASEALMRVARWLDDAPDVVIIAISAQANRATLYRATRAPRALDDLSPNALVALIRVQTA
jgi:chemotaxis response regulator CheB